MIRFFKKTLLFVLKALGLFLGLLILLFAIKYISCPVYDFYSGEPFSGEYIYNPYEGMDPADWHKGNFQIQSKAWGGLTAGQGNSNEDIHALYESFGYEIIGTSDYQKINAYGKDEPGYVPVYEHGYGISKTHQVLLGAKKVLWKDYPLFQTIHNKQHIINSLRDDNSLIFLAHPVLRHAYSKDDVKTLTGYDGIEVLSNRHLAADHWDVALSAGNYVTILGNDDAHDISNLHEIAQQCTFINSVKLDEKSIIAAFKLGRVYGARIWPPIGGNLKEKIKRTKVLPKLIRHDLSSDTLFVACDSVVRFIRFIGQDRKVLKTTENTDATWYKIEKQDTYVRAEIHFWEESTLYMNPVCRNNGNQLTTIPPATVNLWKTWVLRIVGFGTLIFLAFNIFYLKRRMARRSTS